MKEIPKSTADKDLWRRYLRSLHRVTVEPNRRKDIRRCIRQLFIDELWVDRRPLSKSLFVTSRTGHVMLGAVALEEKVC